MFNDYIWKGSIKTIMNKIASFTVNHLDLLAGVYVSRKDYQGDVVLTTFDLRFTRPNVEAPMDTAGIHSIEHLMATFLRNNKEWADKTIYFGPMGCRTGFYVIFAGDLKSEDILEVLREGAEYVLSYEGEIPGYSPRDCGNYLDNNLTLAKLYMKKFKEEVFQISNLWLRLFLPLLLLRPLSFLKALVYLQRLN